MKTMTDGFVLNFADDAQRIEVEAIFRKTAEEFGIKVIGVFPQVILVSQPHVYIAPKDTAASESVFDQSENRKFFENTDRFRNRFHEQMVEKYIVGRSKPELAIVGNDRVNLTFNFKPRTQPARASL